LGLLLGGKSYSSISRILILDFYYFFLIFSLLLLIWVNFISGLKSARLWDLLELFEALYKCFEASEMNLWNKFVFCVMQHVIFVGTKIKSNLSRYKWPYGLIPFNCNSVGVLRQVSIVSHFSNLIFSFLGEVSSLLRVVWPHDQEVRITYTSRLRINICWVG
jgi:hypothetical protein